jgi:uncharacterized DUF497 family protein
MFDVEGFQWDAGNREKCQKHGVSIREIEYALRGEISVYPDVQHSDVEQRVIAVGRTETGRHLFIAFTLRGRLIRPSSARYMHRKEVIRYEEAQEATDPEE